MKCMSLMWVGWMVIGALGSGCTTLNQRRSSGTTGTIIAEPSGATKAEVSRLQGRVDELEVEIKHLRGEFDRWRVDSERDVQEQRVRVGAIEESVRSNRAAWDEDKKEIVRLLKLASGGGATGAGGNTPRPVERGLEHVVKTGETLSQIARAYKVSVERIVSANRIKDNRIFVGQKLFIPE